MAMDHPSTYDVCTARGKGGPPKAEVDSLCVRIQKREEGKGSKNAKIVLMSFVDGPLAEHHNLPGLPPNILL